METQDALVEAGGWRDARSEAVNMDLEQLQPGGEGANAQGAPESTSTPNVSSIPDSMRIP
jgi:hypothetical protein